MYYDVDAAAAADDVLVVSLLPSLVFSHSGVV